MQTKLYIDGRFTEALNGTTFDVINPADENVLASVCAASISDVDLSVQAARRAFDHGGWRHTSGKQRAGYLNAIAAGILSKRDEFALLETLNNGKPLPEAEWDIDDVIGCFKYYAELAEKLDEHNSDSILLDDPNFTSRATREPIGVAALIVPWNFPLLMAAWKIAPALAAGCTIVLKASEVTPLTALKLAEVIDQVKLPAGVVNILTGIGIDCGAPLASHPDIDKLAFTGSTTTGSQIMKAAAEGIKPVTLELGGKSPLIIFDDSDINAAVEWAMFGVFWNKGEICSATSRILVQDGLYDAFIKRLAEATAQIKIGNGLEEGVKMGPLVNQAQYQKVMKYIERGIEEGARLLVGGKRPSNYAHGYYLEPTVFVDVEVNTTIWREEIFGPVVCVRRFSTEEEAVAIANDSEFGLAAAIISEDLERCDRVAAALDAGIIWVNCSQPTFVQAPWGGCKKSGIGRELGPWGLNNYLRTKQITTYTTKQPWGWYLKH